MVKNYRFCSFRNKKTILSEPQRLASKIVKKLPALGTNRIAGFGGSARSQACKKISWDMVCWESVICQRLPSWILMKILIYGGISNYFSWWLRSKISQTKTFCCYWYCLVLWLIIEHIKPQSTEFLLSLKLLNRKLCWGLGHLNLALLALGETSLLNIYTPVILTFLGIFHFL